LNYFRYVFQEKQKKEIASVIGYSVLKKMLKVQEDDKNFKTLEKVLGFDKYLQAKETETFEDIKNKVLRRVKD